MSDALSQIAEDYDAFYDEKIAPKLRNLEAQRRNTVYGIAALSAIAVFGLLGFIYHEELATRFGISENVIAISAMLALVGGGGLAFAVYTRIRDMVKAALVAPTCAFLGLDYSLKGDGFPLTRFDEGGILPKYDKSKLQDRIRGSHDGVAFELCEAHLEVVSTTRRSGNKETEYQRVFDGLLLIYHFPKSFRGHTVVVPDRTWLGNKIAGRKHGERVMLEDPRFEEIYAAFSDDQVEARYLLTPTFMERLTALAEHLSARNALAFAFQDNDLLIAFHSKVGHFEGGSLFKPLENPERSKQLLEELRMIYDLVERLNLINRTGI